MSLPKGYCNHVVLIVCEGTRCHPSGYSLIRYLIHGWGTRHYWHEHPRLNVYLKIKLEHPEYDKDEIILHGLCDYCKAHQPRIKSSSVKSA